jgi:hypothetical protein
VTDPHIVTQAEAAAACGVIDRTIRNWISRGWVTGYRVPGARAVQVDLNEARAVARERAPYGPDARIVTVGGER